ncbi:MAG: PAS domain S-box protein [Carboxydocellales bacterium]
MRYLCSRIPRRLRRFPGGVQAVNDELNAIIQTSHDGILIADGKGMIMRVNQAVERLLECTAQELTGKNVKELVELGIINRSVTTEVLRTQKPATLKQKTAQGKETIATGTPIYDQEGRIFRVVTNIRDITELVELELALEGATVLILGESGVGKEVIAKLIHRTSSKLNLGRNNLKI